MDWLTNYASYLFWISELVEYRRTETIYPKMGDKPLHLYQAHQSVVTKGFQPIPEDLRYKGPCFNALCIKIIYYFPFIVVQGKLWEC